MCSECIGHLRVVFATTSQISLSPACVARRMGYGYKNRGGFGNVVTPGASCVRIGVWSLGPPPRDPYASPATALCDACFSDPFSIWAKIVSKCTMRLIHSSMV